MSKLKFYELQVSENTKEEVIITCEGLGSSPQGAPRFLLTLFSVRGVSGQQWSLKVDGYRKRADGKYHHTGYVRSEEALMDELHQMVQGQMNQLGEV